jgi:hypothetical protein
MTIPRKNTPQQQNKPVPQTKKTKDTKKRQREKIWKHQWDTLKGPKENEELFFNKCITQAEDERTMIAKENKTNAQRLAIDDAHDYRTKPTVGLWQYGRNITYKIKSAFNRTLKSINKTKHVRFSPQHKVRLIKDNSVVMITYNSGADGHYISEKDREAARLPILRPSTKRVMVANGEKSKSQHVTSLPFPSLSLIARQADTFKEFPTSLMGIGKTADDGKISIFTKDGVIVHDEKDVLITCKNKPLFIGVRDKHGRYRIPLVQRRGQWQPRHPSKKARHALNQAKSVYDLPSTEQAIKWMHVVCGYPVKTTWIRAIKAGNYVGWPMLTERNVSKYYPETDETIKGNMNQTQKNVRSTKTKRVPFEIAEYPEMRGKKIQDVYIKTHNVRETTFSDQTGEFSTRSKSGNK